MYARRNPQSPKPKAQSLATYYAPVSAYAFGDYLVDAAARRVTRGGDVVPIPDRHVGVLVHLLAHAGAVVSKDGLIESAWSGLAVTDNSLEQAISGLRRVLGDGPDGTPYIQTVPRQGYRFTGPVTRTTARASDDSLDALLAPHRAWIEGRAALETLEADQIVHARGVFEGVLRGAPDQASAHVGLANACVMQFEMTRADESPDTAALTMAAHHAREACRLGPTTARHGRRSASCSIAPAVTPTPSPHRDARSRSKPTTGGIISGWPRSAGVKNDCAKRAARWRCSLAVRSRTGCAPPCTSRDRRGTRPNASWTRALPARRVSRPGRRDSAASRCTGSAVSCIWLAAMSLARSSRSNASCHSKRAAISTRASAARTPGTRSAPSIGAGNNDKRPRRRLSRRSRGCRGIRWRSWACNVMHPAATAPPACRRSVVRRRDRSALVRCQLVLAGDSATAARLLDQALVVAPSGNAGWLLPVEPTLNVSAEPDIWSSALARLQRAPRDQTHPIRQSSLVNRQFMIRTARGEACLVVLVMSLTRAPASSRRG